MPDSNFWKEGNSDHIKAGLLASGADRSAALHGYISSWSRSDPGVPRGYLKGLPHGEIHGYTPTDDRTVRR